MSTEMGHSLDVVIVNWNAGRQLRDCLAALWSGKAGVNLRRVVVVDNGSTDGSADDLDDLALPLRVIRNERNLGFGAACNQGARGSDAEFLLFLNPDTRVSPDALYRSSAALLRLEPEGVGILGVRLVDEEGRTARSCARFPTVKHWLNHSLGLSRLSPKFFPGLFLAHWNHAHSGVVDHVMGAFTLLRRSLFEELGGFDERFFVYLEDLDLSLRAHRAGRASYFLADVEVYHKGGGTSQQVKARRLFYSLRSRLTFCQKHMSPAEAAVVSSATLFIEPWTRLAKSLVSGGVRDTAEAYILLWRSFR